MLLTHRKALAPAITSIVCVVNKNTVQRPLKLVSQRSQTMHEIYHLIKWHNFKCTCVHIYTAYFSMGTVAMCYFLVARSVKHTSKTV